MHLTRSRSHSEVVPPPIYALRARLLHAAASPRNAPNAATTPRQNGTRTLCSLCSWVSKHGRTSVFLHGLEQVPRERLGIFVAEGLAPCCSWELCFDSRLGLERQRVDDMTIALRPMLSPTVESRAPLCFWHRASVASMHNQVTSYKRT